MRLAKNEFVNKILTYIALFFGFLSACTSITNKTFIFNSINCFIFYYFLFKVINKFPNRHLYFYLFFDFYF